MGIGRPPSIIYNVGKLSDKSSVGKYFSVNIIVYSIRKTKGLESLCSFFPMAKHVFASKVPKVSQTSKFGFAKLKRRRRVSKS